MIKRSQLEAQITDALARLSPEDMQRVAEDYARLRYPVRFPRFDFRAFSAEGRSRPGWPDAWVCVDGRLDGVEATIEKDKSGVTRHLQKDLENAAKRVPPLSGLIIVSGCPTVNLSPEEITAWRQRFVADAGIDARRVELVFGGGLVAELARPEFARTRIEVLGLRDAPVHFKLIRARHSPDEGRLDSAFIPSEKDYADRRVHRADAADQVLAQLEREGRVLVRGVGASGKTVLAWLLGLEATERRLPAYYLDLAGYGNTSTGIANALIADLHRFAHPDSLFMLDNCHLDEPLAKEVAAYWEELSQDQRPRLLLLGRELRTTRGSAIDGLSIPVIALRARQAEVLGVYRRLAGRYTDGAPPEPPPEVLDAWVNTFGGDPDVPETTTDLIAFSAAVLGQMQRLRRGDWALDASHAVAEVRNAYLHKLSPGERRNLLRLCAFQQIELALSEQALADRHEGLRDSTLRLGLVFKYRVGGSGQWTRYRLAHAALENLIVAAAPDPIDKASERCEAALQHPHTGAAMIGRLLAVGIDDEARELARLMLNRPECLCELGSLGYVQLFLDRLRQLGLTFPPSFGAALGSGATRDWLAERALETPLGELANFLGYAARTEGLKDVFSNLAEDLGMPEHRERLAERALETPLHFYPSFLGYAARTDGLKKVYSNLTADLGTPIHRLRLTERVLETPFVHLRSFLGYVAKAGEFKQVFSNLVEDLGMQKSRARLVERAMETPLGDLAQFLGNAANTGEFRELTQVFSNLAKDLGMPEHRERLAERALESPLGNLARFMGHAATTAELKDVFCDLAEDLTVQNSRERLTGRALKTPLGDLASVLGYAARTRALNERTDVFSNIAMDLGMPEHRERLAELALEAPLSDLANFLAYTAKTEGLKHVFANLAEDLAMQESRERLVERALNTPLGDLAQILGDAVETEDLKVVFADLVEELGMSKQRERLAERALETPLGELANFLGYAADTEQLNEAFSDLVVQLGMPNQRERLTERALKTPLGDLADFLAYAAGTEPLKTVFSNLAKDLAMPERRARLAERALEAPLGDLAKFLGYTARTGRLTGVISDLARNLGMPEHRERLAERALETPLGELAHFLGDGASTGELKDVVSDLASDLGMPEYRTRLAERALETSLPTLAKFLDYAGRTNESQDVFSTLAEDLSTQESRERLVARALGTPLSELANFLGYVATTPNLKPLYNAVAEDLAQPENIQQLAIAMEQQRLDAVVSILRLDVANELWDTVFTHIDSDRWAKARTLENTARPDAFVTFQSIAAQKERQDLSVAPALRIVAGSTPDDWHQPGIGLHHLSHVLRHAREMALADIECFLDRIATPEWVDELVKTVSAGGLAGNLLSLAASLEPDRRKWFLRDALRERIEHQLSSDRMNDDGSRAQALSLLGSIAALDLSFSIARAEWPDSRDLTEVLELRQPDPGRETIGPLQVQLWLGLREMARTRADHVTVPPRLADKVLDLWIATKESETGRALPPHVRSLNDDMITWLQRCKAADWRLVRP